MTRKPDKELFQDMVAYYGQIYGLTPLSAKVYVYLMFDFCREGVTFDELLETFKVSKSSLSGSLQTLLHNKHIEYVTSIDSRKRLFRTEPHYTYIRFSEVLDNLKREKELIERFTAFRKKSTCDNKITTSSLNEFSEILNHHIKTITSTLNQLKK